jgi:hypothetical protein
MESILQLLQYVSKTELRPDEKLFKPCLHFVMGWKIHFIVLDRYITQDETKTYAKISVFFNANIIKMYLDAIDIAKNIDDQTYLVNIKHDLENTNETNKEINVNPSLGPHSRSSVDSVSVISDICNLINQIDSYQEELCLG